MILSEVLFMTYKQIVHKIIYDSGYAKDIADLIEQARKGDKAAVKELNNRFEPLPDELEDIGLTKEVLSCAVNKELFKTDPTTRWMLLDFAAMLK
jgi:hypothetical protein